MAKLTQGTQLYVIDPYDNSVFEVACATAISGIEASRDQIETTCLSGLARTYEAGMPSPGQAQISLNADGREASHVRLHELYRAGTKVEWAIGWAGSTTAPTADSNGTFNLPTTRDWTTFNGFVSNFPFDFALNAVVTSSVTVQLSDFPEWVPAA